MGRLCRLCCRGLRRLLRSARIFLLFQQTLSLAHENSVLRSPGFETRRPLGGRALGAKRGLWFIALCLALVAHCVSVLGCATLGGRGRMAVDAAAGRELCQEGVAAMERGHWQQAEVLLQQALHASPDDPETHRYLAEALWHRGVVEEAMSHMAAAVSLDPSDPQLAVRGGEMSLALGATDQALAYADDAIRLDPKLAKAWALRGRAFRRLKQTDRAMADLQRALELAPNEAAVLLEIAVLYRERGQPARALAAVHHLLDVYPPGEEPQNALFLEGMVLLDLQRPHQAAESLLAAARRGPPSADLLYRLAQAQWGAGQYADAAASAKEALAIDASHQPSRDLLVQLASFDEREQVVR
jgi:tetratricopeptide (TPR) repeat protein